MSSLSFDPIFPRIFAVPSIYMVIIEPVTVQDLQMFKAIRLRALKESPSAFGSTYTRESVFSDEEWMARATRWNGEMGIGYIAMEDGAGCGIAGALVEPDTPTQARLVSMWSAPSHRRRGVGQMLVEEVTRWAQRRGLRTLLLTVVSNNEGAIRFYHRLGFAMTGFTEPYPNDAALFEYEMSRPI